MTTQWWHDTPKILSKNPKKEGKKMGLSISYLERTYRFVFQPKDKSKFGGKRRFYVGSGQLQDYIVSGLCVVALSKNLKLTTTHSWAITQSPCYVPFLFGR